MRRKLLSPEAAGSLSAGNPSNVMVSNAMKKVPMAKPCTSVGTANTHALASGGYADRMKYETAKITKEPVANHPASKRPMNLHTNGATTSPVMPLGEVTS